MLKSYKPTSPGQRGKRSLDRSHLAKKRPEKSLVKPKKGHVGRANGSISSRFRSQGARKHFRLVDFKRNKYNIPAKVAAIEYDPNRGPDVALLHYADGEKRYILAPEGLEAGMTVYSGENVELTVGNALPLKNIPLGFSVHNIEINPGQGGILARSAGNSASLLAKEGAYVNVKLPSGEVKRVLETCYATIGSLSNADLRHTKYGKAGVRRHKGRRPHVRGLAMANPKDHPHAGSYSDKGTGHPKTPWGKPTRGFKTRKRKMTNKYLVTPRKRKR